MSNLSQTFRSRQPAGSVNAVESLGQKLIAFVLREFVQGLVAVRTRDLIENLLDVNDIEQFIAKKERCDVCELIRESLQRNQTVAARKQIIFLSGLPASLWTRADRGALLQVLDNLIFNAVKYSPPNATIQVHALLEHDSIVINVRDQGMGINDAGRQKLFQKFTRLMACPANGKFSSGLGLAIVEKLAGRLSGSLRCRSALGSGSTVTLTLPVSSGPEDLSESADIKLLVRSIIDIPALHSRN